jgi:hypothetical protein
MRARAKRTLSRLASAAYTERYVLHGTADEYVLREEMVDEACSIAEAALSTVIGKRVFSGAELEAFARFATVGRMLEAALPLSDASVSNEQLLRAREWIELRTAAQQCLRALGVQASEWEEYGDS